MCPKNVIHAVDFQEFLHHLRAKCVSSASWAQTELVSIAVWVRPYQIRHWSFVWNFSEAVDDFYLINAVYARTQTAVYAEDFIVYNAAEGQVVEHVGKVVPHSWIAIFSAAFSVEAVGLSDTATFVVTPNEMYSFWVSQFQADQ